MKRGRPADDIDGEIFINAARQLVSAARRGGGNSPARGRGRGRQTEGHLYGRGQRGRGRAGQPAHSQDQPSGMQRAQGLAPAAQTIFPLGQGAPCAQGNNTGSPFGQGAPCAQGDNPSAPFGQGSLPCAQGARAQGSSRILTAPTSAPSVLATSEFPVPADALARLAQFTRADGSHDLEGLLQHEMSLPIPDRKVACMRFLTFHWGCPGLAAQGCTGYHSMEQRRRRENCLCTDQLAGLPCSRGFRGHLGQFHRIPGKPLPAHPPLSSSGGSRSTPAAASSGGHSSQLVASAAAAVPLRTLPAYGSGLIPRRFVAASPMDVAAHHEWRASLIVAEESSFEEETLAQLWASHYKGCSSTFWVGELGELPAEMTDQKAFILGVLKHDEAVRMQCELPIQARVYASWSPRPFTPVTNVDWFSAGLGEHKPVSALTDLGYPFGPAVDKYISVDNLSPFRKEWVDCLGDPDMFLENGSINTSPAFQLRLPQYMAPPFLVLCDLLPPTVTNDTDMETNADAGPSGSAHE